MRGTDHKPLKGPKGPDEPRTVPDEPEAGRLLATNPPHRRLKVFSLDPAVDAKLEHALISRSVLPIAWEPVEPGPVGEYLEVIDVDPSSGCVYDPIDLNEPNLLAQDGLSPSTGNPQFHQQMVYAVAMKTIANFEQVLGRKLLWAERRNDSNKTIAQADRRYVQRLRIYPHALREQNAYYSPAKAALLFGYFNASTTDPRDELPGGIVFSCLSHDIIAHEMTHAILHGMHRRMLDVTNPDMIAFHEAFADIVAIFQHFTVPGLLLDQIQRSRGSMRANGLLATLASQFARATGQGDALRNALGSFDDEGRQEPPDPTVLGRTFEPHARGAILVAAVFDAFVRMYESRVSDLRRIASGGTGVLPEGDIHPDLARRFAEEAVRLSQRVLNMCIRAIDYLPPVDVNFGDFLRALITADADFFPDDPRRYRLAFIDAFRNRGIYPLDIRALAEDALRWNPLDPQEWKRIESVLPPAAVLQTMAAAYDSARMTTNFGNGGSWDFVNELRAGNFDNAVARFLVTAWKSTAPPEGGRDRRKPDLGERYSRYLIERMFAIFLNEWIRAQARAGALDHPKIRWHLGIDLGEMGGAAADGPTFEVHAVRPTVRLRSDGRSRVELLIVLAQRVKLELRSDPQDPDTAVIGPDGKPLTFLFRGGSTLIVDPEAAAVTYSVAKNITGDRRRARHMAFLRDQIAQQGTAAIARFGLTAQTQEQLRTLEPFALAHTGTDDSGTY